MDKLLLRTFLVVVEAGSFSAAATSLGCVQSNITARVRRLERHFGQPVFDRGRGGARLTPFGERVLDHARDLLARFDAAERALLDAAGEAAPLRLGAMETTAAARLPALLKRLRSEAPRAPISVATAPTGELVRDVWDRRLDAALVAGPVDAERFTSALMFREELVSVFAHDAADEGLPLIAFRATCSYRAAADGWLRQEGRPDTEIIEMGTFDGIVGCVDAGIGFAVLPRRAITRHPAAPTLAVAALPDPFRVSETHLIWRRDSPTTHALRCLARAGGVSGPGSA